MKENPQNFRYGIIEVTRHCQCRCPGCYMVRRQELNGRDMTKQVAIKVLDMCREYRGTELESMDILGGEPLLWPYFQWYVELLLSRGIKPWLFTNMLAITPSMAKWLRDRDVFVTGKMNIDPGSAEQLPLQADMIGASMATARRLLNAVSVFTDAGYSEPMFRLENLVRRANLESIPGFYRWCLAHNIGADIELMGCGDGFDAEYWKVAPTPQQIAGMIAKLQAVRAESGLSKQPVLMPHIFSTCRFYDSGLYFDCDGNIRACSNSNVNLANLIDSDAVSVARNSPLIKARLSLSKDNIGEPCAACNRFGECQGGCRASCEQGGKTPFAGYSVCPVPLL